MIILAVADEISPALWDYYIPGRLDGYDLILSCGDLPDPAHVGFQAFVYLINEYRPMLFLHGHTHIRYDTTVVRERTLGSTRVINVSERYSLEIPERPVSDGQKGELIWITRRKKTYDGY